VGYSLNAFDVLGPPLLALWVLARGRETQVAGPAAPVALRDAERRLVRAVLAYFAIGALSLSLIAMRSGMANAAESAITLVRGFQGVLAFGLARWLVRSESGAHATIRALLVGGAIFAVINVLALASTSVVRAGLTWFANEPLWSVGGANEAGAAMLLLWALVLVRQAWRPRGRNWIMLSVILALLVLTQSRSGLLAWLTFTMVTLRRSQWRPVIIGLVLLAGAIPLVPAWYWERIARTLVLERGSFEAFSSLVRVYGWEAAWKVFLDHPLFGVGYVGFRFMSADYNSLGVVLVTAESIFLETATGMGIIGLTALIIAIVRLYQLGFAIRRVAAPGSLAGAMARYHAPFVTASLAANLTGDNWVGLVGLAQIALWCGLLVSAAERSSTGPQS
jgi:O-antigen ligase